jgi:hypothetical protein
VAAAAVITAGIAAVLTEVATAVIMAAIAAVLTEVVIGAATAEIAGSSTGGHVTDRS